MSSVSRCVYNNVGNQDCVHDEWYSNIPTRTLYFLFFILNYDKSFSYLFTKLVSVSTSVQLNATIPDKYLYIAEDMLIWMDSVYSLAIATEYTLKYNIFFYYVYDLLKP